MPPDHSTAASGTLPTEQTKLATAISGPTTTFSIARSAGGPSWMNRPLKKSSPSWATKPASRKPAVISFHSIVQSPRKLWATSDQAAAEVSRSRNGPAAPEDSCWWPASAWIACSRARRSSAGETSSRRLTAIRAIITSPPRYSARVNCQPISTHSTSPSSHTRFVEANWKASAVTAEAPLANRLLPMAIAVGAARRRRPQRRGQAHRLRPGARERRLDALARHPGLHDRRDREAQHERPPHLPRHQEGVLQAVQNRVHTPRGLY